MSIIWIILAIFLQFLRFANSLEIYKSTVPLGENEMISGLHYQKSADQKNVVLTNSITVCLRFNFKRLSSGNKARIFAIANPYVPKPGEWTKDFLYMYARYPATWFNFGYMEKGNGYFTGRVFKDLT